MLLLRSKSIVCNLQLNVTHQILFNIELNVTQHVTKWDISPLCGPVISYSTKAIAIKCVDSIVHLQQ